MVGDGCPSERQERVKLLPKIAGITESRISTEGISVGKGQEEVTHDFRFLKH